MNTVKFNESVEVFIYNPELRINTTWFYKFKRFLLKIKKIILMDYTNG